MSSRESCGGEKIDEVRAAMQVVQEDQTLLSWELEWVNPHCLCMVDSCIHRWVLCWGCITPTRTHQAAPLAWLRIMCLHSHAHTEEAPIPPLWSALRADPPLIGAHLASHLISFLSFTYLVAFLLPFRCFSNSSKCCAKAVSVQCLPSKVRKMGKAIWHTRRREKCKQEQLCQILSEAEQKAGSETRTVKVTQVLYWALQ